MIDQLLIKNSQDQVVNSFVKRAATPSDQLWIVNNVFPDDVLKKLQNYLSNSVDLPWESVRGQESLPRLGILWDPDTVIEELYEICAFLTNAVNCAYPEEHKHFWGISIWKDTGGYEIGWHTDNPDIDVAMQIYLFSDGNLGTTFLLNGQEYLIPGIHKSGYIACHSADFKPPHRSQGTVLPGQIRYSLYAVWSRFPKHVANPN